MQIFLVSFSETIKYFGDAVRLVTLRDEAILVDKSAIESSHTSDQNTKQTAVVAKEVQRILFTNHHWMEDISIDQSFDLNAVYSNALHLDDIGHHDVVYAVCMFIQHVYTAVYTVCMFLVIWDQFTLEELDFALIFFYKVCWLRTVNRLWEFSGW